MRVYIFAVFLLIFAGCEGEPEPESNSETEASNLSAATAIANTLQIDSESVAARNDSLSGRWNLRPNDLMAWYAGAEVLQCATTGMCGGVSGEVDPPNVLEILCEEHNFCVDTSIPVEFEQTRVGTLLTEFSLYAGGSTEGFRGFLVHYLGVAAFDIGADWAGYDGVYVDAIGGYASQMGMTPTRPERDDGFDGSYDGVFLLEIVGGASIAGLLVPVGGVMVAVPFDAVNCDLYPDDCTR